MIFIYRSENALLLLQRSVLNMLLVTGAVEQSQSSAIGITAAHLDCVGVLHLLEWLTDAIGASASPDLTTAFLLHVITSSK